MLDVRLIEEKKDEVIQNLKMRKFDTSVIDKIIDLNSERKKLISIVEDTRSEINSKSKEIGLKIKSGENADDEKAAVSKLKASIEEQEKNLGEVDKKISDILLGIPNLIEEDTPIGDDEESNLEIKKFGDIPSFSFKIKDHATLGEELGMLDFETAAKLTGARFVVYKGMLARLERAVANYMINFHCERGYEEIIPPYIVQASTLYGTGQLPKFGEDLFKIEGRDWYLIPTAEVPVTNLLRETILKEESFQKKYVSFTPCFRSEAGSYGKDTRGLIRMHQFSKVEMVQITDAESSLKAHEEMLESGCMILEELKLPYRAVRLCTGDIGFGARKTYDLEVWLPSQEKYREISSISNCWDFQARRAKIRYKKDKKNYFAHTLNGSGLAVGRTVVAILENYQQADGSIVVPEKLVDYMGGIEVIKPS